MLGVGVQAPRDALAKQLLPWALAGLVINCATGIPMFMSAAPNYSTNTPFAIKMALLLAAVVVQLAIHKIPAVSGGSLAMKVAACVSLTCWFGIAYAGRAIAFTNLGSSAESVGRFRLR